MMRGMVIDMNDKQLLTLAQLQAFLDGTVEVDFAVAPGERYDFISRTLGRFGYRRTPNRAPATVTTTHRPSPKMRLSCANTWAIAIYGGDLVEQPRGTPCRVLDQPRVLA